MQLRRLRHALVAVIVPAALVGLTVGPADAAAKAPKVPAPAKVAAAYPHLAGVTPATYSGKAQPGTCTPAKVVKGAKVSSASYTTAATATASAPYVLVAATRFKSAAKAKAYLKGAIKVAKCTAEAAGFTMTTAKIGFKLKGTDQRLGYSSHQTIAGTAVSSETLLARKGEKVVSVTAISADANVPALAPALQLLKAGVKTAR
ncbi:hypothetical protein [Nocardioides nitrophenolicus]|uniref:hypothetical protein n=1 Tax=Nocardioides nitrophenolicus TaxID=60489 RepID=UPI001958006A|nr:hypothetical protein [Nocardioides nitrophenolicus]MBM7519276.1 hypothetical protein [Nocardioides nitrophenolicus]